MAGFKLSDYEPVEERLAKFWADHPDGRVVTELVEREGNEWIFRTELYRDPDDTRPYSTGYAQEIDGSTNVNKTSACENCETSSTGRALANAGYAPKGKRPSREEMEKVQRGPQSRSAPRDPGQDSAPQPASDEAKGTIVELLGALPEGERQAANETLENSGGLGWLDVLTAEQASRTIGWLRRRHDALREQVEA